jgi:catechol 2,3-dioxygenase-like lactoylglutathione lyase family enzyme
MQQLRRPLRSFIAMMTGLKKVCAMTTLLRGIHHSAFRCRDAEETRRFYEDVLGLPLAAALTFDEEPGTGKPHPYMHLFFALGDGNFIAFFDAPDSAKPKHFFPSHGFDRHVAFETSDLASLTAMKARLDTAGIANFGPIDHHFVHSLYMWDPNGLQVEVTYRDPHHDAIMAKEASEAHTTMARWTEATRPKKDPLFNPPTPA